jgi:hypothetical protein
VPEGGKQKEGGKYKMRKSKDVRKERGKDGKEGGRERRK